MTYISFSVCEYSFSTPVLVDLANQPLLDLVKTTTYTTPIFEYTDNSNSTVAAITTQANFLFDAVDLAPGLASGSFDMKTEITFANLPAVAGQELILTFTVNVGYCPMSLTSYSSYSVDL